MTDQKKNRLLRAGALVVALAMAAPALAGNRRSDRREQTCTEFSELAMRLEQNATDGDTEVVFFAKGQDDGLAHLSIRAPGGRQVAEVEGDRRGIGMREFALESAEPPEIEKVLRSFPEGAYSFRGRSVAGECLRGTAFLSHSLAPQSEILTPVAGAVVPVDAVVVSWASVPEAVVYVVEVKNEETQNALLVEVPAPAYSFAVPAGWLAPDSAYQVAVGVKTLEGNLTNVEISFFTAP